MNSNEIPMSITGEILSLRPSGYLNDEACQRLRAAVDSKLGEGFKKVIINLEQVTVINSPGITQLLELAEVLMYDHKGKLAFACVPQLYLEVFQVIGLSRLSSIFSTEALAMEKL